MKSRFFLLEPGTNHYLGRLCYFRQCPAAKRDCLAAGCGQQPFLKQHDAFSFWPDAIAEGAAIRLYDRIGGGMIARAADLPSIILDADPREVGRQGDGGYRSEVRSALARALAARRRAALPSTNPLA
jgi:hypothetical protein